MPVLANNKWGIRLGYYKWNKRGDGLAFITEATTKALNHNSMIWCSHKDEERMKEVARVFYPMIFEDIKSMKRQGWKGVVLQKTFFQDEDGKHDRTFFNNLINEYVNIRGKVEWRK